MVAEGKVAAGNLQVDSIDVALVQSDTAVDCHLLVRAAAHGVIGTFHHCVAFRVGKCHGAVFRVVDRAAQMSAELYEHFRFSGLLSNEIEIKCRKGTELVEKSSSPCASMNRNMKKLNRNRYNKAQKVEHYPPFIENNY